MTTAAYDAIAAWYDHSIRQGSLLHETAELSLFGFVPDVGGMLLCDLACGQGHFARQLTRRGAQVVGLDISERLLEIAREHEGAEPLGVVYHQGDAQVLSFDHEIAVMEATFEGVVCSMALMDIPDLKAALGAARRLLQPQGWLFLVITHPCFQIPPHEGYFVEGFWRSDNPDGVRGRVGAHHRTLTTYLNAVAQAGFVLEQTDEPRLPGREVPVLLALLCRALP
jgi:2-polyprenyl-3-methyl-5-hydroxy-6-metoxy-1,4-benzoquinol methylase